LADFSRLLHSFAGLHIAVIGDLMLDEYLWGHMERISPEAPVPILNVVRRAHSLGGAGNVVENLRSLAVQVTALGVTGEDETGRQISRLLADHGVDVMGVIADSQRQSTRKVRLMSLEHGQQVFRFDQESTSPIDDKIEDKMIQAIRCLDGGVRAIVCSDYLKGVFSERILRAIFTIARERNIPTIVAPKDTDAEKYQGADILLPNLRELQQLSGKRPGADFSLGESAQALIKKLSLKALVVTRGSAGMSLFEIFESDLRRVDISTTARSVYDVTGAGDTAIAAFAAVVAAGFPLEDAARLANISAGIKVGKRGPTTVTLEEIRQSLK
jgi:D-beta-D-heptose 7-phosphate kinase/D-beta-D-heptose 1-phosphate adenosyltransferase